MKGLTRKITGIKLCGQIGSFAIAVRSVGARGPKGLGCAVLDVVDATTAPVFGNIGLYFSNLITGPANKAGARVRPIVLGMSSVCRHQANKTNGSKTIANPHLSLRSVLPYAVTRS
jgi:hypothetical protein